MHEGLDRYDSCYLDDLCKSLDRSHREQQKDPLYNSDIGTKKVFLTEIFDLLSLTSHIQQGQDAGFEIAAMAR
jgi:hypothetical protein